MTEPSSIRNLTPTDVATRLNLNVQTVRRLMAAGAEKGGIGSSNISSRPASRRKILRTSEADIAAWLRTRETGIASKERKRRRASQQPRSRYVYFRE